MAGPSLGTAYVQVVASAQGIKGSITQAMSGEAASAGSKAGSTIAGKIKGAIIAAGIGTAIVGGFKAALSETGALQQSYLGGLDTLYGDAADKAREYARAAAEAGISQNSFSEQAVSFGAALKQAYGGNTTKAMEAANTAILDMADNAAKMGTPLQSIQDAYQGFAKQNYTMLDNLKLGYGGTKTEMERLLKDAQEISGVEYDIDNLGDVYSAIHVIQGELGLTGVAADEAKSTLTGSFEGMKAAWQNLIGNIGLGQNVSESMQGFTDAMSNYLFNNLIPTIGTILQQLPTAIGTFIQTGAPQLINAGLNMVKSISDGVKKNFPTLLASLVSGLTNLTGKLRTGLTKFIDLGLNVIKNIANGIIKNIPTFIQAAPKIITSLVGFISDNMPKIISTGVSIIKNLVIGIIKAIPTLVASIPQIFKAFFSGFEEMDWASIGKAAVSGIVKGVKGMAGLVKSAASHIASRIVSAIKSVPGKITGAISTIKTKLSFSGLATKVKEVFDSIKEKITSPITKAKEKVSEIIETIKGWFPFSIGKVFSFSLPSISIGSKTEKVGEKTATAPTFSVGYRRFAKAMRQPYMFDSETIFGAGEAGSEVLYGRNALMRDIASASSGGGEIVVNLNYDASDDANEMVRDLTRNIRRYRMAGVI